MRLCCAYYKRTKKVLRSKAKKFVWILVEKFPIFALCCGVGVGKKTKKCVAKNKATNFRRLLAWLAPIDYFSFTDEEEKWWCGGNDKQSSSRYNDDDDMHNIYSKFLNNPTKMLATPPKSTEDLLGGECC